MKLPPGSKLTQRVLKSRPISAASLAGVRIANRRDLAGPVVGICVVLLLLLLAYPRNGAWLLSSQQRVFDRPTAVSPLASTNFESRTVAGARQSVTPQASRPPSTTSHAQSTPTPAIPSAPVRATPGAAAPASVPRPTAVPASPAAVKLVTAYAQLALINTDRGLAGLKPLSWNSCLASVALANAQRMAVIGSVVHTTGVRADFGCGLGTSAGENLGDWTGGIDDSQLNSMFMASADHRANILGTAYSYVGVAWAVAPNGTAYIAEEFG